MTVTAFVLSRDILSAGILGYKLVIYSLSACVCVGCMFLFSLQSVSVAFGVVTGIGLTPICHLTLVIFGRSIWKPKQRILRTPAYRQNSLGATEGMLCDWNLPSFLLTLTPNWLCLVVS